MLRKKKIFILLILTLSLITQNRVIRIISFENQGEQEEHQFIFGFTEIFPYTLDPHTTVSSYFH